jgi:hypothetical protein
MTSTRPFTWRTASSSCRRGRAKIEAIIETGIGRPRARVLPEFLQLRAKILQILHFTGQRQDLQYYL